VGESQRWPFQLSFNRFLRVAFQASRVTSDGGLILVRELDERFGLNELIEQRLRDSRGKNTQLPLGGRLVKHARYYWLLLAESHLTRRLFASLLGQIAGLPVPAG